MSSCTVLNPLGTQVIRRPGHLSGCDGEGVLGESTCYLLLVLLRNFNSLLHA
jgi:hypothetical protein